MRYVQLTPSLRDPKKRLGPHTSDQESVAHTAAGISLPIFRNYIWGSYLPQGGMYAGPLRVLD